MRDLYRRRTIRPAMSGASIRLPRNRPCWMLKKSNVPLPNRRATTINLLTAQSWLSAIRSRLKYRRLASGLRSNRGTSTLHRWAASPSRR